MNAPVLDPQRADDEEDIYTRRAWADPGVAQASSVQFGLLLLLVVSALIVFWTVWSLITAG